MVQKNPSFFKTQSTGVFRVLLGFGLYWVFGFFYFIEQLGSLLADLTHQLSFYLDLPVILDYLKFANSLLIWLEAVNIKKSLTITDMTN